MTARCDECGREFDTEYGLNEHQKQTHDKIKTNLLYKWSK